MRVLLSSRGSRGDVFPVLAISRELARRGHDVRLCVPENFRSIARQIGNELHCYDEDSDEVMRSMGSGWRAARNALEWFTRGIEAQFELLVPASAGADVLVSSVNEVAASSVAEHRGIPHFRVALAPVIPGEQPPPLQPYQRLPTLLNRASWLALNASTDVLFGRQINRTRRELGLDPVRRMPDCLAASSHTLLAISPMISPPARGWRYPYTYTGYLHDFDSAALDPALERFLERGPKPVYVGFGSVNIEDPRRMTATILEAVRLSGCRAVIERGWTGLGGGPSPEGVIFVDEVPHARLLPLVHGIAHHGGSGTIHSAARAGIPQFVMPQIADQYYWGHRMHALGLGPRPVPPKDLTAARLARALNELSSPSYRSRAASLSRRIRQENGVEKACSVIEGRGGKRRGNVKLQQTERNLP
ncbi:MAG: glycosyltransferase family 1 protein [Deltaproteobacteria bacterium]|nr:glycosyltransferase family 1 protein [Deltaproteobacteria bacterium]